LLFSALYDVRDGRESAGPPVFLKLVDEHGHPTENENNLDSRQVLTSPESHKKREDYKQNSANPVPVFAPDF
jgi:hypothetical protein